MILNSQVAIVTGAGDGIGRAIAMALADEGSHVWALDIDGKKAAAVAAEIQSRGGQAFSEAIDVSQGEAVRAAFARIYHKHGRIDILVNNAGICQRASIADITERDWDRILAVNLKGTFLCSQAVMAIMKQQRRGKIINLGSVAGKVGGIAVGAHYSASKAAVMCFTKSLARDLAPFNVNVNAIAPGVIATDMTQRITGGDWSQYLETIPLGRIGMVEEVAHVAVFLASPSSSYLTGEIIDVNGGQLMD